MQRSAEEQYLDLFATLTPEEKRADYEYGLRYLIDLLMAGRELPAVLTPTPCQEQRR
jgi:hypothetical protein